jgi:hypothetical protein
MPGDVGRVVARWGLVVVALVGAATSGGAQGPVVPELLTETVAGARVPAIVLNRLETLQSRVARVNFGALDADVVDLDLTGGRRVRARLDRREFMRNGTQTWAGHIPGEPLSSVTLVAHGGVLQGSVRTLDAAYSIEPGEAGGLHVVRQIDTDAVGVDLDPIPAGDAPIPAGDDPPMAGDDGSTIDVLAFYTAAARTAAGGSDANVQTRIALGVSESNVAYANSGVTPRLRLVGAEFISYTESGNLGTDLDRFQKTSDGQLDAVHARRDALGADMMVLVVGDVAAGACGMGYIMTSLSSSFAPWAFSVTAYPCISPNYTFGHELGHNMGSAHAPEDGAGQASLYPYSFGYKNPSNLFRTVMAYNCTSNCPRVLHFSNPNVSYGGATTGSVSQHNNAQSINNAASTLANFRQAVGGGTAPTISAIANVTIAEDAASAPIAFTVGDAETVAGSLVVTATSANTALVPNTSAALALGGSGASRTLTVTPAANQSGSAAITVTVNDGARTATRTFTVTVTAVNDAPGVTRSPAAATIVSGSSTQTTVTVSDIDTAGSALSLSTSSSNTTVLPNANVSFVVTATTATSRTFQVTMTSVAGQSGASTVTLTGSDGAALTPTTFALTVGVPAPPTVSAINGQAMPEDGSLAVAFTVGDPDTALSSLGVQASSTNAALTPASGLVVSGTGSARTLTITPAANQSGSATITVAVSDGSTTVTSAFGLTVNAVNDPPVYGSVPASVSTLVSTTTSFQVTVSDVETAGASLTLSGTTTNGAVLADAGIAISPVSSTATSRTFSVTLTPVTGATGTGGVSLAARDAQATVTRLVGLTVTAAPTVPDAPTALTASAATGKLNLSWTPAGTGSAATSYAVYVGTSPGGTTLPVQTTTGTSIAVTITTTGTYYARVRAQNAQGQSSNSPEASAAVTASKGKPGSPKPRASSSGRTVSIDWDPPVSGDPVSSYTLEVGSAPGLANLVVAPLGAATTFAAAGVPDGTFWLRIRGVNAAGPGDASEDIGLLMSPAGGCVGLPLAPGLQTPVPSGGAVALTWTAPAGGVEPTGYVLYAGSAPGRSNLAAFHTGSTLTRWNGGAPPGIYYVRVAARSACGVGPVSNEVVLSVGRPAPDTPGLLSGSVSAGVASLAWSAPVTGAAPTGYVLEVGATSGASDIASIETGSVATSIAGPLAPGQYFVRVRARAAGAVGPASNEVSLTVP